MNARADYDLPPTSSFHPEPLGPKIELARHNIARLCVALITRDLRRAFLDRYEGIRGVFARRRLEREIRALWKKH